MSDENLRQLRILHIVGSGGVPAGLQQSLFMPLLTRMPKQRVKAQVVCLSPGAVPASVLRQNGVPVHDVPLSRQRFALHGFRDLLQAVRLFRPDVIQAWGHTAQIISGLVRKRCEWKPRVVWNVANTAPLARDAGFIDRQKLKVAARLSAGADRIVYTSEAGASQHRRAGFPDGGHLAVSPGVDAARFKPDSSVRHKVREQLQLEPEAFVIGMVAPFQPEYDYATLLKAVGDLIKTNPGISVVLAGHGVQKGNGSLMALVGGGTLGTRTQLLGEWSDVAALLNACDMVCSSALTDNARMTLVMAMLCGVPCVATGMGAQGEVIGQFGVAIEPGSPAAFIRGITKVMQLPPEKRAHMTQGARKHALKNFVHVRSLQKYLQLYCDLIGREALLAEEAPAPEDEENVPVQKRTTRDTQPRNANAAGTTNGESRGTTGREPRGVTGPKSHGTTGKEPHGAIGKESCGTSKNLVALAELSDPDSLEAQVAQIAEELPKWRLAQERQRAEQDAPRAPSPRSEGDVLEVFESEISRSATPQVSAMSERARGVAEDVEELLAPELLSAPVPSVPRQ